MKVTKLSLYRSSLRSILRIRLIDATAARHDALVWRCGLSNNLKLTDLESSSRTKPQSESQ